MGKSNMRVLVISKKRHFDFIRSQLLDAEITEDIPSGSGQQLICFGSGKIIPKETLDSWDVAINFHAASPAYPGRDPHHWAVYDGARNYGATVHAMWSEVDAGPIYGQLGAVTKGTLTPDEYKEIGETAMYSLFSSWCSSPSDFSLETGIEWSGKKRARRHLLEMCDMRGLENEEKLRRKRAFIGFEDHFIEDETDE